jgi:hypothetical protein
MHTARAHQPAAPARGLPAAPLKPIPPLTPLNILDKTGYPLRNDNTTNFGYVGNGNGTTPPEQYIAYHAGNEDNPSPIKPGQTTIFQNVETGMWCRLAPFTPQQGCNTQGMLCDQESSATATVLTYTGLGLIYGGVALVQQPGTKTLVLSNDPACSVPDGDRLTFPPGASVRTRRLPVLQMRLLQLPAVQMLVLSTRFNVDSLQCARLHQSLYLPPRHVH